MNKELEKKLSDLLGQYGYTPNGFESGTDFKTIGFWGDGDKIFIKWKVIK